MRLEDAAAHRLGGSAERNGINQKSVSLPAQTEKSKPSISEKDNSKANPKTDRSSIRKFRPGARFNSYTPLNDTVENIYLATQQELKYKRPLFRKESRTMMKSGNSVASTNPTAIIPKIANT